MKGVIFDMDGVLCDSEFFIAEAAVRMFELNHGVRVKAADFVPFVGTGEDRYLGGVADIYGVKLDAVSDKKTTYGIYLDIIKGRMQPMKGVKSFLSECRRRGLKMALATSADRVKMDGNLREIGVPLTTFDSTVNGLEVEKKKPAPDIFLLAASRLGLPACECLVVEDAVNGVQAAKTAGARCLGLTSSFPGETLQAAGADWIAPDLAGVPAGALEW